VNEGATLAPYKRQFPGVDAYGRKAKPRGRAEGFRQGRLRLLCPGAGPGPAVGVAPSFKDPIVVTGTQFRDELAAKLPVRHPRWYWCTGFWGDASSLQGIQDYLRSIKPWSANPGTVNVMQYATDLAFDYTEPKSPPSRVPPASSLGSAIQTALALLDKKQFVGGRVDSSPIAWAASSPLLFAARRLSRLAGPQFGTIPRNRHGRHTGTRSEVATFSHRSSRRPGASALGFRGRSGVGRLVRHRFQYHRPRAALMPIPWHWFRCRVLITARWRRGRCGRSSREVPISRV